MTVALTIHQPYPSLIAHGIKQWETRPHPPAGWPGIPEGTRRMPGCRVEPGETVLIHAAAKRPVHLSRVGEWSVHSRFTEPESGPEIRRLGSVHNGELVPDRYERGLAIPMPLGAVVATARIIDVVPITTHANLGDPECIVAHGDGRLDHCIPEDTDVNGPQHITGSLVPDGAHLIRDISDQLPYGDWTPGRWACRLGDVRLLTEPVREYPACPFGCIASGTIHECSAQSRALCVHPVRGRQGVWRPDPALVAACGVTP